MADSIKAGTCTASGSRDVFGEDAPGSMGKIDRDRIRTGELEHRPTMIDRHIALADKHLASAWPASDMALDIAEEVRQPGYVRTLAYQLRPCLCKMSETLSRSAAKIEAQAAEIERLSATVRDLQASEKLAIARMAAAITRAASDVTGDLSRRIGFLEGRASLGNGASGG